MARHDLRRIREKVRVLESAPPPWWARLERMEEQIQGKFRLRPLLQSVLHTVIELTGADRAVVVAWSGGDGRVAAARSRSGVRVPRAVQDLSRSLARMALEKRAGFIVHDVTADERLSAAPSVAALGIRAAACFPFLFRGDPVGVLYLDSLRGPMPALEGRRDLLEAFCRRVGTAWNVARLAEQRERSRRALDKANLRLRALTRSQARELDGALRREVQMRRRGGASESVRIVGRSEGIRRVLDRVEVAASSDAPVLIVGETGVGKELVARAIHASGSRREAPFVAVNCAAIPDALLESELFGHVAGAFTGANRERAGMFEAAREGTLFLDEISDMSPALQAKLLRAIERGEVRRVGSDETSVVNARVVAATNQDPLPRIRDARFRADLYYRIAVLRIPVPPLRERPEDVADLAADFLRRWGDQAGGRTPTIAPTALALLRRHSWPGNVRELHAILEHALLTGGGRIRASELSALLAQSAPPVEAAPTNGVLSSQLEHAEAEAVRRALTDHRSQTDAARALGIDRSTLWRLRRKHGV